MVNTNLLTGLLLITPITFYFLSMWAAQKRDNNLRKLQSFTLFSATLGVIIAVFAMGLAFSGTQGTTQLLNRWGLGLSIRIDPLSVLIYSMVSIIAAIVLKFSRHYLQGDTREYLFMSRFLAVIPFVQLMTISGNLFMFFVCWFGTGVGLHKLLTVYADRKIARRSSRRKFVIARFADLALLGAFILLYGIYGTGDISTITGEVGKTGMSVNLSFALSLMALAAVLKSVQVPFHTWLFGVLESPTPVSALLHAGLLNAGPFLILRFSPLFVANGPGPLVLIAFGAVSALYGSIVRTTQPRVKTALAYSSVGHMGFSLLLCGFGFFSAALLHLVAHSFYKAHSFLRSGSAVDEIQTTVRKKPIGKISVIRILSGLILASVIYWGVEYIIAQRFHIEANSSFVGYVILIGLSGLLITTLSTTSKTGVIFRTTLFTVLVLVSYHVFEYGLGLTLHSVVHETTGMSWSRSVLALGVISALVNVQILQVVLVSSNPGRSMQSLRVHLRNGLYLEHLFTRKINLRKK